MIKCTSLMVVAAVVGLTPGLATSAVAQSKDALGIANNDSVYIDASSFKVVPGKAAGDASALIGKLDARDLGPGEIIFRSGGKLYAVAASPDQQRYGSDRRDYARDQRDCDPLDSGNRQDCNRRNYANENNGRNYANENNGRNYANENNGRNYASDQVVINDPEYAQYKLKKIFEENWTAKDSK